MAAFILALTADQPQSAAKVKEMGSPKFDLSKLSLLSNIPLAHMASGPEFLNNYFKIIFCNFL